MGRGDFEKYVFFAGLGAKHQRERQAGWWEGRGPLRGDRDVAAGIGAQREERVPGRRHVTGREQHLGQPGVWAIEPSGSRGSSSQIA